MNKLIYNLPIPIKLRIGKVRTIIDFKKRSAIKNVDSLTCSDYPRLNNQAFKSALKNFFCESAWSSDEVVSFTEWLYKDKVGLLYRAKIKKNVPYIICVVKDEADKLINFFNHYNKLGDFNYYFIDNGSKDDTVDIIRKNGGTVYQCLEKFSTNRKLSWINKIYSTFPNGSWTILLDADELLVYDGFETVNFNNLLVKFEEKKINLAGAVMIDMFSQKPCDKEEYISNYVYFQNNFHKEKSVFFNSIYGGIREREFRISENDFGNGRVFLIKKHPVIKKNSSTLLIHCHYIYPFIRNYKSEVYFGLLHYKLFDSEIEKYKKIAADGGYGNGSTEYKSYLKMFSEKSYEEIFKADENTLKFEGTNTLSKIKMIKDIRTL